MTWSHISAIAWLTVRDAVRSRLLVSLSAILITGLISLPLLISGGNTLDGQVQIILKYTLAFAMGMLSAVTLWASCGGISAEIQDRRLYLVLTKPVYRHELWLGKWLGIVGINALLLLVTGLLIQAMVWHTFHASSEPDVVKHQVREQYCLARESVFPKDHGVRHITLPPGGAITLDYPLPRPASGNHDLILNYSFEASRPERMPVAASWSIVVAPDRTMLLAVTNYPGLPCAIVIPGRMAAGSTNVRLAYSRKDPENPATLRMTADKGEPELLIPAGGGGMNLARGLFIILCRLAFLAALGLTAGSLLSMPVAVFVAFFVMILLALSGYVESVATSGVFYIAHEGPDPTQTRLDLVVLSLFKIFAAATQPLVRFDPIPLIEEGRRISWNFTGQAVVWLAGLYTALMALIGITLFNRRELG